MVGRAYKFLLELRLDKGVIGKEAAAEALREWARTERSGLLSTISDLDREHVWHPYAQVPQEAPAHVVSRADGVRLTLEDGRELVDGMSSWWAAIHGYSHPRLDRALTDQLRDMAHVMFGGLTHPPGDRAGAPRGHHDGAAEGVLRRLRLGGRRGRDEDGVPVHGREPPVHG